MGINKYSWKKYKSTPANFKKVNELANHRKSSGDPMYFFDNGNYVIYSYKNNWVYDNGLVSQICVGIFWLFGSGLMKHLWKNVGKIYFNGTKWTYEGNVEAEKLARCLISEHSYLFNHKHALKLNESRTDDNK